jgi:uncharacterized membrane protein YgcG
MGVVLAGEWMTRRPATRLKIVRAEADCRTSGEQAVCMRAFAAARQAHDRHAATHASDDSCRRRAEICEPAQGSFRPVMTAVGYERRDGKIIARALYKLPRQEAEYVTSAIGETSDPDERRSFSSSSSSGSSGGSSSSGVSSNSDVSTRGGGGEHVATSGSHGVTRGGFGAVGRSMGFHGG